MNVGYTIGLDDKSHDYDSAEERYQKMKHVCSKFLAFQIGFCTFKWDDTKKNYTVRPFCFYVFPRSQINDKTMLFQVSPTNSLSHRHPCLGKRSEFPD